MVGEHQCADFLSRTQNLKKFYFLVIFLHIMVNWVYLARRQKSPFPKNIILFFNCNTASWQKIMHSLGRTYRSFILLLPILLVGSDALKCYNCEEKAHSDETHNHCPTGNPKQEEECAPDAVGCMVNQEYYVIKSCISAAEVTCYKDYGLMLEQGKCKSTMKMNHEYLALKNCTMYAHSDGKIINQEPPSDVDHSLNNAQDIDLLKVTVCFCTGDYCNSKTAFQNGAGAPHPLNLVRIVVWISPAWWTGQLLI